MFVVIVYLNSGFILHRFCEKAGMANRACFIIVSQNEIPIYEAEVGSAVKV